MRNLQVAARKANTVENQIVFKILYGLFRCAPEFGGAGGKSSMSDRSNNNLKGKRSIDYEKQP